MRLITSAHAWFGTPKVELSMRACVPPSTVPRLHTFICQFYQVVGCRIVSLRIGHMNSESSHYIGRTVAKSCMMHATVLEHFHASQAFKFACECVTLGRRTFAAAILLCAASEAQRVLHRQ